MPFKENEEGQTKSGGFDGFVCKCGKRSTFKDQKFIEGLHVEGRDDWAKLIPIELKCGICQAYLCTIVVLESCYE